MPVPSTQPVASALNTPLAPSRALLARATRVIVIAGAGMSADIGTPVYWTGDNAAYGDTVSHYGHTKLEHSCAPLWLEEPDQQAAFFRETWRDMRESEKPARPADPYFVLQDWLDAAAKDYFVLTSNVDTAFTDHGFPAERLLEIHGAYDRSQCLREPEGHGVFPTVDPSLGSTFCPTCGSVARPNVLFFDDYWFNNAANELQEDDFLEYQRPIAGGELGSTVILEVGVGLTVMNLRNLTWDLHSRYDLPIVRINPFHVGRGDAVSARRAPIYEHQLTALVGLRALLA